MIRSIDSRRALTAGARARAQSCWCCEADLLSAAPRRSHRRHGGGRPASGTGVENNDYPRIIRLAAPAPTRNGRGRQPAR